MISDPKELIERARSVQAGGPMGVVQVARDAPTERDEATGRDREAAELIGLSPLAMHRVLHALPSPSTVSPASPRPGPAPEVGAGIGISPGGVVIVGGTSYFLLAAVHGLTHNPVAAVSHAAKGIAAVCGVPGSVRQTRKFFKKHEHDKGVGQVAGRVSDALAKFDQPIRFHRSSTPHSTDLPPDFSQAVRGYVSPTDGTFVPLASYPQAGITPGLGLWALTLGGKVPAVLIPGATEGPSATDSTPAAS